MSAPAPSTPAQAGPVVRIAGLHKSFGTREVLTGVDLEVDQGEVVCIIGASGSGKSTLLRCVNLLEQPTSGTVEVLGVEVTDPDVDIDRVRAHAGMVFQQFNLFPHRSVLENCTLAQRQVLKRSRAEAEAIARKNLAHVGLADRTDSMPAQLSGGQQQRVAIARAVVTDPAILVADEPTGDLDRHSAGEILDLVDRLNHESGKTIIMVTHDPRAADKAHTIRYLEKGELKDVCA